MIFSKVISQQFNHYQYVQFRQESMTFLDHYVYYVRGPSNRTNVDRPFITVGSTMTDTLPVDIFPPQRRLHHFIDI